MTLWRLFQTEAVSRRAAWERNLRLVARHNLEASVGKRGFTLELNHLADLVRRPFGEGGSGVGAAPSVCWRDEASSCPPVLSSLQTAQEINERMNGLKVEELPVRNGTFGDTSDIEAPQSVDWRKDGRVSPVQNQVGLCQGDRRGRTE